MTTVFPEPIESVTITILVDNVSDLLLQSEGPANRPPLLDDSAPRLTAPTLEWGESPDIFQAEHGFSALITFTDEVYAVIGGFHLSGAAFEPIIPAVCDELSEISPDVIVPAHCTGWGAVHALVAAFPDAFVQNSVGTWIDL